MQSLRAWLTTNSVHLDPRLDLVQASGGACSVWANTDVEEGVTVARIPKHLVLSHRSSSLSPLLSSPSLPSASLSLVAALHSSPPPLRLAVHVLHELILGPYSRWATYLAACPPFRGGQGDETLAVPIAVLWDEGGEARTWVSGTQLERELRRVKIDQHTLSTFYNKLVLPLLSSLSLHSQPTTSSSPTTPPFYIHPLSLSLFLHAYTLVSTRSFQVDSTGYHALALVPLADVFNHEQEGVHNVQFVSEVWVCAECGRVGVCEHDEPDEGDGVSSASAPTLSPTRRQKAQETDPEEDDTCNLISVSPIPAGSEAFNHYGPHLSNAKLAVEYGFMVEANEWDVVEFEVGEVFSILANLCRGGERVDQVWEELVEHLVSRGMLDLAEHDHPLIAPTPLTVDSPTLSIDADARLSTPLWALLVLLASSSSSPSSSSASSPSPLTLVTAQLTSLSSSLRVLAEWAHQDEGEEGEEAGEREEGADVPPDHVALLRRVAELVQLLAGERIRRQNEPERSGAELLERADNESVPATRLAIEFVAGERLLLERVQENWTFL
ncbi:hypothetical protein JCM11251_003932 [Rhodosporidiobolus azoricus]